MTAIQTEVVNKLSKRGFKVNRVDEATDYQTAVCFMSKRTGKATTAYAEVDEDGSVNGVTLQAFITQR